MCDTLYRKTETSVFFAKNSDRSPNEPNLTVYIEASDGNPSINKHCTYVDIDENRPTLAMILVKPSWMWGAEMGINSCFVAIGNEAVFTKNKDKKTPRLTGMDLLRLGLEEGTSAKKALEVIIWYLEKYGQGGNCGFDKPFYYDNTFLIADKNEAYILETVGRKHIEWQLDREGNISNRLSAMNKESAFFFKKNTEPVFTCFSGSFSREKSLREFPIYGIGNAMAAMRIHRDNIDGSNLFLNGSLRSPCMHFSVLGDHTTSSMIIEWKESHPTIWLTGRSTPCLSPYLPVRFEKPGIPVFKDEKDSLDFWLWHEYLSRAVFSGLIDENAYKRDLESITQKLISLEKDLGDNPSDERLLKFNAEVKNLENDFVKPYEKIVVLIKDDPSKLIGRWKAKTEKLGKNVFSYKLDERKST